LLAPLSWRAERAWATWLERSCYPDCCPRGGLEGSKKGKAEDWERECVFLLLCGVRFGAEERECWRECRERREWRSCVERAGDFAREAEVSRRAGLRGRARVWEERRAAFVILRTGERAARGVALVSGMGVILPRV
jgi:hypothetical protein